MGLDINAYIFDGDTPVENGRLVQDENDYPDKEEIAYWRSFDELRSWLVELDKSRGLDGDINCEYITLGKSDLLAMFDKLIYSESDYKSEIAGTFVGVGLRAIKRGKIVAINCWW